MSLYEFLIAAGGAVTAVGVLVGAVLWLVRPRVDAWARSLVDVATEHNEQLAPGGALRIDAAKAAEAADELPALREDVTRFASDTRGRLEALEAWRGEAEHKLGLFEQALVAILGDELRRRLASDRTTDNRS